VRVDSGVESGSVVQPYYDSMVAKIIVSGRDRDEAIARALRAVRETTWTGPHITLGFVGSILSTEWFRKGDFHTQTIESELAGLLKSL
jgi:acetyl-CoA carboxylase biotin carboxylase subunit